VLTHHVNTDLVDRVATAALGWELDHDYWERQGAMTALLSWGHPDALPVVSRWLDRAVETQTSEGWLCYGATTNLSFGTFRVMDAGIMRGFLDNPLTPLESSGTLMFAAAAGLASGLGVVDDSVADAGLRALDAVAAAVGPDGSVDRVVLPPGGPGVPLSTMPLGTSFFLLAAYHLRARAGLKERLG
jgi:hypothetical protein